MKDIEEIISLTLRIGVIASSLFVIAGLLLFYLNGDKTIYDTSHYSLIDVLRGLAAGRPDSIILFGVIILIATPIVRLLESAVDFAQKRDGLYLLLTTLVLTTTLIGIILLPSFFHK